MRGIQWDVELDDPELARRVRSEAIDKYKLHLTSDKDLADAENEGGFKVVFDDKDTTLAVSHYTVGVIGFSLFDKAPAKPRAADKDRRERDRARSLVP